MQQFFDTLTDDSGNSLLGATVAVTAYPGGGAASIYSTNGTASPIANSTVIADITGQVSFYAPDGAYILTYVYKGTQYKVRSPVQILDPISFLAMTDSGAVNAYVVTDSRIAAQLVPGMKIEFKALATNSGASTLVINGGGAQPIRQPGGGALAAGMIQANGLVRVEWDGTQWQLIGSQSQPFYATFPAETNASVVPANTSYPPLNYYRYGGDGLGGANDAAAYATIALVVAQLATPGGIGGYNNVPAQTYRTTTNFSSGLAAGTWTTMVPAANMAEVGAAYDVHVYVNNNGVDVLASSAAVNAVAKSAATAASPSIATNSTTTQANGIGVISMRYSASALVGATNYAGVDVSVNENLAAGSTISVILIRKANPALIY